MGTRDLWLHLGGGPRLLAKANAAAVVERSW